MSSDNSDLRNAARLSPIDVVSSVESIFEPLLESWSKTLTVQSTQGELRKIIRSSHTILHSIQAYLEAITESYPELGITDAAIRWGAGARVSKLDAETTDPAKLCRLSLIACFSLALRINSEFNQLEEGNFKKIPLSQPARKIWDGGTIVRVRSLCRELIRCLEEFDSQLAELNLTPKKPLDMPMPISRHAPWSSHFRAAQMLLASGLAAEALDRGLEALDSFIRFYLEETPDVDDISLSELIGQVDGLDELAHLCKQAESIRLRHKRSAVSLSMKVLIAESFIHEASLLIAGGLDSSQIWILKEAYSNAKG